MTSRNERADVSARATNGGTGVLEAVGVALLDRSGTIVSTNAAWDNFRLENDDHLTSVGIGICYPQACAAAGDDPAVTAVGAAIGMALRGELPAPMSVLIPCDPPRLPRAYDVLICSRFDDVGGCIGATVSLARATLAEASAHRVRPAFATAPPSAWAPDALPALLRVTEVVADEVNLTQTLERLAESARELLGVRYAAIGLNGCDGVIAEFVPSGIDAHTLQGLQEAAGVLDWLAGKPHFLHRDVVLGGRQLATLYVAEHDAGRCPPDLDRRTGEFAQAAGRAIENARLYQQAQQGHRWSEASAGLIQELVSINSTAPLEVVLRHAARTAEADLASILVPEDETHIRLHAIVGGKQALSPEISFVRDLSPAAQVLRTGKPLLLERPPIQIAEVSDRPMGPVAVVPLAADGTVLGVLVVSRLVDRPPFTAIDVEALSRFTDYAGIALELDRARVDREQLRLHDDRARIAGELHDHVVRQLFAVGMGLEGLLEALPDVELRNRVADYVTALDESIRGIRETIFRIGEG